jgi:hypothetical protein
VIFGMTVPKRQNNSTKQPTPVIVINQIEKSRLAFASSPKLRRQIPRPPLGRPRDHLILAQAVLLGMLNFSFMNIFRDAPRRFAIL